MKIAFIILHFKNQLMTVRCLESVCKEASGNDNIIVIDASHDFKPDVSIVKESVIVSRTPEYNPGFARAMNFGVTQSRKFDPNFLCFINNDTVFGEGFRSGTIKAFDAGPQVAAVGPKIVYLEKPDVIWSAGGYVSHFKMTSRQVRQYRKTSTVGGFFSTNFLSGCVITVKFLKFLEIGGWPDVYLFGGEEWELSNRFLGNGDQLIVSGDVVVFHEAEFEAGQGKSHSFNDIRFVLNGYLNRVVYAERNVSRLRSEVFRAYLILYILFVVPFRWVCVAKAKNLFKKFRYTTAIAKHILFRPRSTRVTWMELSAFADRVENH